MYPLYPYETINPPLPSITLYYYNHLLWSIYPLLPHKPSITLYWTAWLALRNSDSIIDFDTVVCCLDMKLIVPIVSTSIRKAEVERIVGVSPPKFASEKICRETRSILIGFRNVRPWSLTYFKYFKICWVANTCVESQLVIWAHNVLQVNMTDSRVQRMTHITLPTLKW